MAAPQIGVLKRFIIMPKYYHYGKITDFSRLKHIIRDFNVYINPLFVEKSKETCVM